MFFRPVSIDWVLRFPDGMVPKSMCSAIYCGKLYEWMEYTEDLTFGRCEGNNGKIYEVLLIGVGK